MPGIAADRKHKAQVAIEIWREREISQLIKAERRRAKAGRGTAHAAWRGLGPSRLDLGGLRAKPGLRFSVRLAVLLRCAAHK